MGTQKLFRAVSQDEFNDWESKKVFRTARNTLEAKQFFKSLKAVQDFIYNAQVRNFTPSYAVIFELDISNDCLETIQSFSTELDRYEAITIGEDDLPGFNKCIKFVKHHAIRDNV